MIKSDVSFVLNSQSQIFVFELTKDEKIIYTIYDSLFNILESKSLDDQNILKFSNIIDENDIIHLAALASSGNLIYYRFADNKWSQSIIAKFDLRSNLYNQIETLIIKDRIHIIYNYSNLINSNIWTIQHVVLDSKERHNAVRYISRKVPDAFTIDVNSQGVIHLLYRTHSSNNSQIFHGFYNPFTSAWTSSPKQMSPDGVNSIFPCLFVDSKDNLHGLWLEEDKNKHNLKYMKMDSSGRQKYIWKEINLPYIYTSKYPPIILEEENILKLFYQDKNSIFALSSSDYGNSWTKDSDTNISQDTILSKVSSNLHLDINRIKYGYSNLSSSPKLYFFQNYFNKASIESLEEFQLDPMDIGLDFETTPTKLDNLNDINKKLDEILNNQISIDAILKDLLSTQEKIYSKLNNIENLVAENKGSFFSRLFG